MQQNFKLDKFQEEAIKYAKNNYSVIVSAPTGAGKTLIAEYIINECIKNKKGVIYTSPIKALSNQKFRDFSKKYPKKVGILTGDVSINVDSPILIMTTEIFRNAILVNPQKYKDREWVIFDEIHYLDDIERGTVWEEAIILLPPQMKILALSATLSNIDEFVSWLKSVHRFPIKSIVEEKRPVPLHFFFQCNNQFFSSFKELKHSHLIKKHIKSFSFKDKEKEFFHLKPNRLSTLIKYLENKNGLPCIYFSFSRRRCEELAQEVAEVCFLNSSEREKVMSIFDNLIEKFGISSSHINFLSFLIKKGIAYHHAGLLPSLKEIIEQLFSRGLIKMIFTTETFALGINMPAKAVVFDELTKFYGRYTRYLKTRDFYQMAGRAGRRGIDEEGFVIVRVNPHKIDLSSLEKIIYGKYEPIKSQLNSCYATILNLYKLMGKKILNFYPLSFHFYKSNPHEKKETLGLLKRKISLLKNLNYILDKEDISWKADLASKVYSFELPIGEMFSSRFLDSLSEKELFILISSLCYEPRKGEKKPKLSKKIKKIKKEADKFTKYIHRMERKMRIYPLSKKFYFHLAQASWAWFEGTRFHKLSKFCNVDEGEIVRYFRMSIQVFGRYLLLMQLVKN
jgi:superfamily II RNA helicase